MRFQIREQSCQTAAQRRGAAVGGNADREQGHRLRRVRAHVRSPSRAQFSVCSQRSITRLPAWSCTAKRVALPVTEADIVGSSWKSVTVRVPADAAVSCRLDVAEAAP